MRRVGADDVFDHFGRGSPLLRACFVDGQTTFELLLACELLERAGPNAGRTNAAGIELT